ncbi:protein tyrosine phosphatase family protein [Nitrosomonas sp.]|uniref:protein tyrosine phosphatase family protein n=1 Tax=Nitrosomonas sp. TaxID=42353 RepID=UPI0025CF9723|nr:protein tyrosine phosphatase family protein [Nitrosomonas sp.]MCC6916250.1 protein tyrosine phosphatase family protein [Nitrosomonas sp.]
MLFVRFFITAIVLLSSGWVFAVKDQVPYATQVNNLMRYYRATPNIATSGALSQDSIQELAKHSFQTVIDLRNESEGTPAEKKAVEAALMTYINIPVSGDGVNESQLAAFKQALEQASPPILVHCATGNRAGAMWTVYRLNEGIAPDIAFKEGRTAGMNAGMEEKIRKIWCKGAKEGC